MKEKLFADVQNLVFRACSTCAESWYGDFKNLAHPLQYHMFVLDGPVANLGAAIFSLPNSTAAGERTFSAMKKQHSSLRNSLSREKIVKLAAIKVNEQNIERAKSPTVFTRKKELMKLFYSDEFADRFKLSSNRPLDAFSEDLSSFTETQDVNQSEGSIEGIEGCEEPDPHFDEDDALNDAEIVYALE